MDGLTLVTGGAGFIGSHVVDALLASGADVRVLDDFSTGKEENLDDAWALAAQGGAGLQVMEGDVRDEVRMRDAMDGCSGVVHLAAVVSVPRSVEDPVGCDSVTHGGTVNALRAGRGGRRRALRAGLELRRVRRCGGAAHRRDGARRGRSARTPAPSWRPSRRLRRRRRRRADRRRLPAVLQRVRPAAGPRLGLLRASSAASSPRPRPRASR